MSVVGPCSPLLNISSYDSGTTLVWSTLISLTTVMSYELTHVSESKDWILASFKCSRNKLPL